MSVDTQSRILGKVKWFNNKAGYGFITAIDGEYLDKDIFVHYSTINVANEQYKYLVQGEYVEFEVVKSQSETHEYQATKVTGIRGGQIMCESRNVIRSENDEAPVRQSSRPVRQYSRPPQSRKPRVSAPRVKDSVDDGFTTVERKK